MSKRNTIDSMYQQLDRRGSRNFRADTKNRQVDDNMLIMASRLSNDLSTDFASVKQRQRLTKSNEGFVYIVSNKSWPFYLKIGRAIDPIQRVKHFNTYDPTRRFKLRCVKYFRDCKDAEAAMHRVLIKERVRGEWFRVTFDFAYRSLGMMSDSRQI